MTILFAGGNCRDQIRRQLRCDAGVDCDRVLDGDALLRRVRKKIEDNRPYDLIFLDDALPIVDGETALETIRTIEDENGILLGDGAVIVMTSSAQDKKRALVAFRKGCDYYLHLPADHMAVNEIFETIKADRELKSRN